MSDARLPSPDLLIFINVLTFNINIKMSAFPTRLNSKKWTEIVLLLYVDTSMQYATFIARDIVKQNQIHSK